MLLYFVFLFLNPLFLVKSEYNFCKIGEPSPFQYASQRKYNDYDYIIVGAGASGSVVASRLSENPKVTVLLLEAGGPPPATSEIPLCLFKLGGNPDTQWGYYTAPQKNACLNARDQRPLFSQYKALGGCTSHNSMVYVRGNRRDYDRWAQMGAKGWSYDELLPLFKKSEDNVMDNIQTDFHGVGGYQTVSTTTFKSILRDAYFEAGKALGYKEVDYNGENQTGYSRNQLTERYGHRCSTEKAFLRPAADRPNLDILTYARVTKIEFDEPSDGSKRASHVVYDLKNQTSLRVGARKEIILSAGVLNTPHLLLLSGVGPKEDLEKLGIPVIADLPVGHNFHDHIACFQGAWSLNSTVGIMLSSAMTKTEYDLFQEGKGLFTSPDSLENTFFINTKYNDNPDWPDVEIQTKASISFNVLPLLPKYKDQSTTAISVFVLRPKSRGFVKLNSTDPYVQPIVDPNYLAEEEDMLILVEGMKFSRDLTATPALQKYDPQLIRELAPNCNPSLEEWYSEENLICLARRTSSPVAHGCGTAKMGDPDDKTTVVDPRLRVKGVRGLRVADASIMPVLTSGNTMAPCIMIGEKAALVIAEDQEQGNK